MLELAVVGGGVLFFICQGSLPVIKMLYTSFDYTYMGKEFSFPIPTTIFGSLDKRDCPFI